MSKLKAISLLIGVFVFGELFLWPSPAFSQDTSHDSTFFHKLIKIFAPRFPIQLPRDTINIYIIGDVMLHTAQIDRDFAPFLEELTPYADKADLAIANMEFPLGGKPYTGYPAFSSPTSYADYVADKGFNVFLTANNHILDKGDDGLQKTIDYYSSMKHIKFTGAATKDIADSLVNPLILNVNGAKIALVNFTYGTNFGMAGNGNVIHTMNKKDVGAMFDKAKAARADMIIALPHWGEEYVLKHNKKQEEWAEWLAEEGADVIIGSHPHVVQDTTTIHTKDGRKVPVVYSLGNAVSNMSLTNTRLELAATVSIIRYFPRQVELNGVQLEWLWCTLPGNLIDNYKTIVVKEYEDKRDLWKKPSDYDNMMATLKRVKNATGIGK